MLPWWKSYAGVTPASCPAWPDWTRSESKQEEIHGLVSLPLSPSLPRSSPPSVSLCRVAGWQEAVEQLAAAVEPGDFTFLFAFFCWSQVRSRTRGEPRLSWWVQHPHQHQHQPHNTQRWSTKTKPNPTNKLIYYLFFKIFILMRGKLFLSATHFSWNGVWNGDLNFPAVQCGRAARGKGRLHQVRGALPQKQSAPTFPNNKLTHVWSHQWRRSVCRCQTPDFNQENLFPFRRKSHQLFPSLLRITAHHLSICDL